MKPLILSGLLLFAAAGPAVGAASAPDITVAADGSGDFKTIQAALESIPATNAERKVVFIKDGTYKEKVRVDASFVTLRGQSRAGTRIEFPQLDEDFNARPDKIGKAVINLNNANDFIVENLTAENTAGLVGPHAFTILGRGDRTVIMDCNMWSHGADTVSLWLGDRGRYYHARCDFRGSVDFVCPRGWCYLTDCTFYEMKNTAAVWHDGRVNPDMKFVLWNCKFDGVEGWYLARHHVDAQLYFLDCTFSKTMVDKRPARVIYPDDAARNATLDKSNLWGERAYFYNCHRDGGDFAWHADNLAAATNSPGPAQITAAWTFAGTWDPERKDGPVVKQIQRTDAGWEVKFSELVTVKGHPQMTMDSGGPARLQSGSGTDTLIFPSTKKEFAPRVLELNGGAIIASEAGAFLRAAVLTLPKAE